MAVVHLTLVQDSSNVSKENLFFCHPVSWYIAFETAPLFHWFAMVRAHLFKVYHWPLPLSDTDSHCFTHDLHTANTRGHLIRVQLLLCRRTDHGCGNWDLFTQVWLVSTLLHLIWTGAGWWQCGQVLQGWFSGVCIKDKAAVLCMLGCQRQADNPAGQSRSKTASPLGEPSFCLLQL